MSPVFLASYVVGWVILLMLVVGYLGIHKRLRPQPERLHHSDTGLPEATLFPHPGSPALDGSDVSFVRTQGGGTVVVFTSTTCAICQALYPELLSFREKHAELGIVVLMKGQEEQVREMAERHGLNLPVFLLTPTLSSQYQTTYVPFAYLLSNEGMVLAKGVVNTQAQLELLLRMGRRVSIAPGRVSSLAGRG